jgi:hypothetical protein
MRAPFFLTPLYARSRSKVPRNACAAEPSPGGAADVRPPIAYPRRRSWHRCRSAAASCFSSMPEILTSRMPGTGRGRPWCTSRLTVASLQPRSSAASRMVYVSARTSNSSRALRSVSWSAIRSASWVNFPLLSGRRLLGPLRALPGWTETPAFLWYRRSARRARPRGAPWAGPPRARRGRRRAARPAPRRRDRGWCAPDRAATDHAGPEPRQRTPPGVLHGAGNLA